MIFVLMILEILSRHSLSIGAGIQDALIQLFDSKKKLVQQLL